MIPAADHTKRSAAGRPVVAWLLVVAVLGVPQPLSAAVALLLHDAIGAEGEMSGAGHAAIYLSNVCSDDAVTLRRCRGGEQGVVLSTYPGLLSADTPYWLATPLNEYLYGTRGKDDAPLYASRAVRDLVRTRYGRSHPTLAAAGFDAAGAIAGTWPLLVGNVLERTVYMLALDTTAEQDAMVIDALHDRQRQQAFDLSYNNCSDFSRLVLNTYFPGAVRRDAVNDFSFTTPKAIARSLVAFGERHPHLGFTITRSRQVEGPIARSRPPRTLTQTFLRSRKYAALLTLINPVSTTVLHLTYLVSGPFETERAFQDRREDADRMEPIQHKDTINRWAREAVDRGWVANRGALRNLAVDLQSTSVPEFDPDGRLRLRVVINDTPRVIGITPSGTRDPATDAHATYLLWLGLAVRQIDRRHDLPPTIDEMDAELARLRQLRQHERQWPSGRLTFACPDDASCAAPPKAPLWRRILVFLGR